MLVCFAAPCPSLKLPRGACHLGRSPPARNPSCCLLLDRDLYPMPRRRQFIRPTAFRPPHPVDPRRSKPLAGVPARFASRPRLFRHRMDGQVTSGTPGALHRQTPLQRYGPPRVTSVELRLETTAIRLGPRSGAAGEKSSESAGTFDSCHRAACCWQRTKPTCCCCRLCERPGRHAVRSGRWYSVARTPDGRSSGQ